MESFRRRLPHVYPTDTRLFLTWHLYGSLPYNLYPPPHQQNSGRAFVWMDRCLDSAGTGPAFLKQEAIARLVVESILYNAQKLRSYDLDAFAVMPNHVHMLVLPRVSPSRFMQTLKGYTAREANKLLQRSGQPFWQTESYDHAARDCREAERIRRYIEENPVKAGLVERAEDYPWSSANCRWKAETTLGSAGLAACATPGPDDAAIR
jgi:REP element-mobilizing transposase RayT